MQWFRSQWVFCLTLGLVMWLAPRPAAAQLAPTGGHYAGRPSDTGYTSGLVNAAGGFAASVPLDVPPTRGGLPVPLQITYGARGVGAAGLGWDVPLSYVRRDTSLARRRPAFGDDTPPQPREQVFLSLLGQSAELIRQGEVWVARIGTLELTARVTNNTWHVDDGAGRTYTFVEPTLLAGTGLWLLKEVTVAGDANTLQLDYDITEPPLNGGTGVAINLTRVAYNWGHTGCAKHEVVLTYGDVSASPLSLSMLGDRVLVRTRTLELVDVQSRASCAHAFERLRRYAFEYQPDGDTRQPRLRAVRLLGRQGTAEETTAIPIASYQYGTASRPTRFEYGWTQSLPLPAEVDEVDRKQIASTGVDGTVARPEGAGTPYATWQSLTDVTGDGRPDFIFQHNSQLWMARNRPGEAGRSTFGAPPPGGEPAIGPLSDTTFVHGPFETRSATRPRFTSEAYNMDYVWRQALDVNGDGRVDIIDAAEEAHHWVVYLNTPGDGAAGVTWVRRSFSITRLRHHLERRGHFASIADFVPLAKRFTGRTFTVGACLIYNGTDWVDFPAGWGQQCNNFLPEEPGPEQTFTEWEVTDFNGDGYPDVVFNSSPVGFVEEWLVGPPPDTAPVGTVMNVGRRHKAQPTQGDGNNVDAVLNLRGVRFDSGENPFSAPVTVRSQQACGVGKWVANVHEQDSFIYEYQRQLCAIADVNGDGVPDRIEGTQAFLGTGSSFSPVHLTLHGQVSQSSAQVRTCVRPDPPPEGNTTYDAHQVQGLRDLTGDGIPDFVQLDIGGDWFVWIGTGTGFARRIRIHVGGTPGGRGFELSRQTERCDGSVSSTHSGLYDLDGDGKPEVVRVDANSQSLDVYHLAGSTVPRTPEAGRLVQVDNGYGARTTIRYRSAKEDGTTPHQVPFPEVVVTEVETTDPLGGSLLSETRYAYGGAELLFDSARDAFTFPAYQRTVTLNNFLDTHGQAIGPATITDTYQLSPFTPTLSKQERFARMQRVGRVRDVYTLHGTTGSDPWALLRVDERFDERISGATHHEWDVKRYEEPVGPIDHFYDCVDMPLPLDYAGSLDSGPVGDARLTESAGAPPAAEGALAAYFVPTEGTQHVIYRSGDGHLHELWWTTGTPGHARLTESAGAPRAAEGALAAYFVPTEGTQHVIYRSGDGHLHELWWTTGTPGHARLTESAGAPPAAEGALAAYFVPTEGTQHVIYRSGDGHLHELWWTTGTPGHARLTESAGAPPAAEGALAAYFVPTEGTQHVIYRSGDGHLHELWWWTNRLDVCRTHGFAFAVATESWRGAHLFNSVQTRAQALDVDDFGRVLTSWQENDRADPDDDLCVTTTYATPVEGSRVLAAPASRRLWDCREGSPTYDRTYAAESREYDGLPPGSVAAGRMTGHTVERRAPDTGELLRPVRAFDASYDAAGNPTTLTTRRDPVVGLSDGATRTVTIDYEPFGLAPVRVTTKASDALQMPVVVEYDPISLDPLTVRDPHGSPNGTLRGQDFDGFGRVRHTTVTPPDGPRGVLATVRYLGFAGADPLGRRIVSTSFTDPVAPEHVGDAVGRTGTVYLDELGRPRRTELALGADYAHETLIVGARTYDGLGRVSFAADPYPASQDARTAYGTTYHFQRDGWPDCVIRGRGPQPLISVTDELTERYPTCFEHPYLNNRQIVGVRDPASLLAGSPQAGVVQYARVTAIGRVVSRWTRGDGIGNDPTTGPWLEHAAYTYDHLGQLTGLTRYHDPDAAGSANPVHWAWRFDSLGQLLQSQEPESAPQSITYSDWGEPLEVQWTDTTTSPPVDRRLVSTYDAFGRLTHREERLNGVTDPDTVYDYLYDGRVSMPQGNPTHVWGRLGQAKAPTGAVAFSYDAFGRVNARMFTDPERIVYVEKPTHHADGTLAALEFFLPDTGHAKERVVYAHDSAARLRAITFVDEAGGRQDLFEASEIDPFGRVRQARYGGTVDYAASYADVGRRLLDEVTVTSAHGARHISFLATDPVGREQSRRERTDGAASGLQTDVTYDALGRLATAVQTDGAATLFSRQFTYDALGNVLGLADAVGTRDATLSYRPEGAMTPDDDRDRLCRIGYGDGGLGGTDCNVLHDAVGNIVAQATRTGQRQLSYFASGQVRSITEQDITARFRYDAFGGVQELDLEGGGAADTRHDRRYGGLIERRDAILGGAMTSVIARQIPGSGGIAASRRGPTNEWVFQFGEPRGNRFFTDQDGTFIQDVDYRV